MADLANQTNAPYVCITESHLNPDILDAEISIPGYNIFISDRIGRSHGGVVTYVIKDLLVKTVVQDSNSYCVSLALTIPQLNLVIINIYRPPNCPEVMFTRTLEYLSVFLRNMEEYEQCAYTYLVFGDFNFPFLKFSDNEDLSDSIKSCSNCQGGATCSHTSSDRRQAKALVDFANEFFLEQYIKKPTRGNNILDLVFTNDHLLIHSYQTIVNSRLSDHFTICLNLN